MVPLPSRLRPAGRGGHSQGECPRGVPDVDHGPPLASAAKHEDHLILTDRLPGSRHGADRRAFLDRNPPTAGQSASRAFLSSSIASPN